MLTREKLVRVRLLVPLQLKGWIIRKLGNYTYQLISPDTEVNKTVSVYMRNVTSQGRAQEDKRRFQMMNIETSEGIENLLIGWSDEFDVCIAWDPNLHIGQAPQAMLSCYTSVLKAASDDGYAAGTRDNNLFGVVEKYIAFTPDFLDTYISTSDVLFNSEDDFTIAEPSVRTTIPTAATAIPETFTEEEFERRERTRTTIEKVRDHRFKRKLLNAYERQCAVCRTNIEAILEGAHIRAVADGGNDEVTNGILLCANHHAMYDKGLIKINEHYTVAVNCAEAAGEAWYQELATTYANRIHLPVDTAKHPSQENLLYRNSR